ncbi:MAG: hypothetical protein ACKO9H_19800 [Planctomycetota bacterium]
MSVWIVPTLENDDAEIDSLLNDTQFWGASTAECLGLLDKAANDLSVTPFSSFVDASLMMCDEEGEPLDDYEPGDFTDSTEVLRSVQGVLTAIAIMNETEFPEMEYKQHLLDNWAALVPVIKLASDKKIRILFQLG